MSLELYFADLIRVSGAQKIILESDNFDSTYNVAEATKRRLSTPKKHYGPPSCPLRQESRECLVSSPSMKRPLKTKPQQQQQQPLNEFYNEVAPGLRHPNSKKSLSPPSGSVRRLLTAGVITEVLGRSLDCDIRTSFPPSSSLPEESLQDKKSICQYLDEVHDVVVNGNVGEHDLTSRRWSLPLPVSPTSGSKDRRWSEGHTNNNATVQ